MELATVSPAAIDPEAALVLAVAALPLPLDDASRRWNLRTATAAWLRSQESAHTRRAYFRDLADYLAWCEQTGLDPRSAKRADVDAYAAARCANLSPSSRARRLSVISSWYKYLLSNEVTTTNPVQAVKRPKVNHDASPTAGLTGDQAAAFMRAARSRTGPTARRDAALLALLAELGLRIGEALALTFGSFRHNLGHRTVVVLGKGSKPRELPIPVPLGRDLDTYLDQRAAAAGVPVDEMEGPVFVTATGKRVDPAAAFRLVRLTAAAAAIPGAEHLSPHSLRHTVITTALAKGAPLHAVQDMAGHADPRTTRRYDRNRGSLDQSPAYLIAGLFAHDDR